MIEAWVVTPLYSDGSKGVPQLFYEEPPEYYVYDLEYKIERIAFLPLENKK